MKTVRQVQEVVDHGGQVILNGVEVGEQTYNVQVSNGGGRLSLAFLNKGGGEDYVIRIFDGKVSFHRTLWRPDHDHDDHQTLQVMEDGKLQWYSRFPYDGEGRKFFEIPFGSVSE